MSRRQALRFDTEVLKDARSTAGLSQEGVARESGVALRTYIRWEQGMTQPKGAHLLALANALSLNPEQLYSLAPEEKAA